MLTLAAPPCLKDPVLRNEPPLAMTSFSWICLPSEHQRRDNSTSSATGCTCTAHAIKDQLLSAITTSSKTIKQEAFLCFIMLMMRVINNFVVALLLVGRQSAPTPSTSWNQLYKKISRILRRRYIYIHTRKVTFLSEPRIMSMISSLVECSTLISFTCSSLSPGSKPVSTCLLLAIGSAKMTVLLTATLFFFFVFFWRQKQES